jgi:hypothetical protein
MPASSGWGNFCAVNSLMSLLLDLSNIAGGFLLAISLLRVTPRVGEDLGRGAAVLAPFAWIVGIVALVAGGYFLLVHITDGPHIFYFELVGIGVGVALLWDRLRPASGRHSDAPAAAAGTGDVTTKAEPLTGTALLLAIFGIIAIIVGIQGLFTPN